MNNKLKLHYQAAKLGISDFMRGVVPYVGYHHNKNLGDVELYKIAKRFYLDKSLATDIQKRGRYFNISRLRTSDFYFVGGGTLIFADNILKACKWLETYSLKPIFLGTGALDKIPEDTALKDWGRLLRNAEYLGVRGEISQKILAEQGVKSEQLGDLGFLVNYDMEAPLASNMELVIVPRSIRPSYYEYFEKDFSSRELLKDLVLLALEKKVKVKIVCVSVDDAPVVRGWLKQLPDVEYIEYRGDFDTFKSAIIAGGCVVSMRMHPGIFASAWGVPCIMLDQRHKYFDSFSPFKNSVVDIVDPSQLDARTLFTLVLERLEESFSERLNRFKSIRQLAKFQYQFFEKLNQR